MPQSSRNFARRCTLPAAGSRILAQISGSGRLPADFAGPVRPAGALGCWQLAPKCGKPRAHRRNLIDRSCRFPRPIRACSKRSPRAAMPSRRRSRRPSSQPEAAGRDLVVSAQTGSGKTVAFGLAMAPELLGEARAVRRRPARRWRWSSRPTRELALQVERELRLALRAHRRPRRRLRRRHGHPARAARAGAGRAHRRRHARAACATISSAATSTSRRCASWCSTRPTRCSTWAFARTSSSSSTPRPAERRTLLFSATMPKPIARPGQALPARRAAHRDRRRATRRTATSSTGRCASRPNEREHAVVNLLRFFEAPRAMVFCATREAVRHLHANLLERGFAAVALSGELTQNERNHALQALRDGRARVCVATDVAARGLDLPTSAWSSTPTCRTTRDPAAPQRPHRPRRQEGHRGADRALHRAAAAPSSCCAAPTSRPTGSAPPLGRARSARKRPASGCSTSSTPVESCRRGRARARHARCWPSAARRTIAAALVRAHRAGAAAARGADRRQRRRAAPRATAQPSGRARRRSRTRSGSGWMSAARQNADPRWLIPLICRRGHVTKQRDRRDPHLRPRDPLRDRPPRRRPLRRRRRPPRHRGRLGPDRAAADRAAGTAQHHNAGPGAWPAEQPAGCYRTPRALHGRPSIPGQPQPPAQNR